MTKEEIVFLRGNYECLSCHELRRFDKQGKATTRLLCKRCGKKTQHVKLVAKSGTLPFSWGPVAVQDKMPSPVGYAPVKDRELIQETDLMYCATMRYWILIGHRYPNMVGNVCVEKEYPPIISLKKEAN